MLQNIKCSISNTSTNTHSAYFSSFDEVGGFFIDERDHSVVRVGEYNAGGFAFRVGDVIDLGNVLPGAFFAFSRDSGGDLCFEGVSNIFYYLRILGLAGPGRLAS
jgi:hypothetical protein